MVTIPWTSTKTDEAATVHQISRLELASYRHVPGFLVAALRLRRSTLWAPGAIGVSLRAAPLGRTFWTLSSWTDRDAIAAFVASDAHAAVMHAYRPRMSGSRFHTWTVRTDGSAAEPAPSLTEATRRLESTT